MSKTRDEKENTHSSPKPAVTRNSAGLRDALFDEIDALRNGGSNATRANAVAKLASTIVDSVRMEIEAHNSASRSAGAAKIIPSALPEPLHLGVTQ